MSVIALDSLVEGHRSAVPPRAIFCQVDLASRPQIETVFAQHKIDAVMHFAAEALVAKSVSEPSIFYATNVAGRSEEHTSELQSLTNLVCRLLLEKKKIGK